MTHHDVPDRELVSWFAEDARRRVPDRLIEAVVETTQPRRQQPGWLVALRGDAMGSRHGAVTLRRALVLVVIAALIVVAAAIIAGQAKPLHAGQLAYVHDGDVYLAEPDGSAAKLVFRQDGVAFATVAWSSTGLLALDSDVGVVVLDPSTGTTSLVGGHAPVWSADGRRLAVLIRIPGPTLQDGDSPGIRIVDSATRATQATYPFSAVGGLSWSPDGRWIAATGGQSGKAVIRIDVSTGEERQIAAPSGHLDSPKEVAWSPDSQRIAYIRYREEQGNAHCSDSIACHIDVVLADADGGYAHVLNAHPGTADQPSWSPDGQWIAFRDITANELGPVGLRVVRADGTGERSLVTAKVRSYLWSPDGDSILYTVADRGRVPSQVWRVSLSGIAQPLGLTIDSGSAPFEVTGLGFAWRAGSGSDQTVSRPSIEAAATPAIATIRPGVTSDPSAIWPTIASDSENGCTPVLISTATAHVTALPNLCDPVANPDQAVSWGGWSPTGSAYAALRQTGVLQTGLAIVGRDGTTEFELALPALSSGVAWSPDGARLAFVVGGDVWVVARAGTGSWSLGTVAVGDAIDVTWSPDGAQLAVLRSDGNLQIGGPDATDLRAVGTYPLPVAWGPHGWPFAFVRDGDVWLVDGMASAPRNLTHLPLGGARSAAWSPDGTEIVVSTASGLLVVAPDGSHPRWLEFPAGAVSVAAWSPDSSRFAVDVSGPDQGVLIVNVDGSASIRVDDVMAPVWSPDGRFLLVNGGGGFLIVNADGSGRRALPNASEWETPVWVR